MEMSLRGAANLFTIKRTRSRQRQTTIHAVDLPGVENGPLRRPLSSQPISLNLGVSRNQSRRGSNLKCLSKQLNNLAPYQQSIPVQIDLESTSSSFTPCLPRNITGVTAQSYCVMGRNSRKIILSNKSDTRRQVASLTKMMTAYTVYRLCKQFDIDMADTMVKVEKEAVEMEGTSAVLRLGDQLSILDLLHGMMLPSGNDAAVALAQFFGKFISYSINETAKDAKSQLTIPNFQQQMTFYDQNYPKDALRLFVFKMNYIAHHQLNIKDTYFSNPTGLQHYRSYSTANDMAQLAVSFLEGSTLQLIASKKVYQCQVRNWKLSTYRTVTWRNTNSLLWKRKDCHGLKTGYTPWAGPCLAAVFSIPKQEDIVIITLNSNDKEERFNDADRVYRWHRKAS